MSGLATRLGGFAVLPMMALVTPLLALPLLSRSAGPDGWAALMVGESVGTLVALVASWGWNTAGPARTAIAPSPDARQQLYHDSLVARGILFAFLCPSGMVLAYLLAQPGARELAVWMVIAAALPGLTFAWFSIGEGDPTAIAVYETIPRVIASVLAAYVIWTNGWVLAYPVFTAIASSGGVILFSRRVLAGRTDSELPTKLRSPLRDLLARDSPIAANDVIAGAYGNLTLPLISVWQPASVTAAYASADKLFRYASFIPLTLAAGLQAWLVEGDPETQARKPARAVVAHLILGVVGGLALATLGSPVSAVLFGTVVAAQPSVMLWLGLAFAAVSVRISLIRHVLIPTGRQRTVLLSSAVTAVLGSVGAAFGAAFHGSAAAAAALAAGELTGVAMILIASAVKHQAASHRER